MQLITINYNIVAFIVMKLRFHCKAACIMTIMGKNYSLTSIVQTTKPRLGPPPSRALFFMAR